MKIAFYISSLSGGGAEKVLTTLANRLANDGHEIHVVSLEKRPQFYKLRESIILHKKNNTNHNRIVENIKDIKFIRECFKTIRADVSISFLSRCNILVLCSNIFNRRKIIVCDRNNPLREHSKMVFFMTNILYRRANKIIVQTNQIKDFYPSYLKDKISVIENPIDKNALEMQLYGEKITKSNTIISMGRLEKQKDYKTLLLAFSKIYTQFPEWNLKIFGIGEDLNELERYTRELGIEKNVFFCGRTEKPFLELKKSKIFVLSSFYEGFPNVLCEAMEAGLICISSDCVSGPKELIHSGENGYLFDVQNTTQLANILSNVMTDYDSSIGEKAHKSVERLSLDKNIKHWEQAIGIE